MLTDASHHNVGQHFAGLNNGASRSEQTQGEYGLDERLRLP